jgi:hypothetical protein
MAFSIKVAGSLSYSVKLITLGVFDLNFTTLQMASTAFSTGAGSGPGFPFFPLAAFAAASFSF